MRLNRVCYRTRQFLITLRAAADPTYLEHARSFLTPAQMALFTRMQPSEQAHAVSVYRQLVEQGETSPDLLAAALLHDTGKSLSPLHLWERVWIVLVKAASPALSRRWGSQPIEGSRCWQRAFVVAEQHPAWGAALAVEAGCSPPTVALIRLHQEPVSMAMEAGIGRLLSKLQAVDDRS